MKEVYITKGIQVKWRTASRARASQGVTSCFWKLVSPPGSEKLGGESHSLSLSLCVKRRKSKILKVKSRGKTHSAQLCFQCLHRRLDFCCSPFLPSSVSSRETLIKRKDKEEISLSHIFLVMLETPDQDVALSFCSSSCDRFRDCF